MCFQDVKIGRKTTILRSTFLGFGPNLLEIGADSRRTRIIMPYGGDGSILLGGLNYEPKLVIHYSSTIILPPIRIEDYGVAVTQPYAVYWTPSGAIVGAAYVVELGLENIGWDGEGLDDKARFT